MSTQERKTDEEMTEYLTFEQHLMERETIVSSFQRILDAKAAQFEENLRLRYSRQEQRQRNPSLQEVRSSEGKIIHRPPPKIFPHLEEGRKPVGALRSAIKETKSSLNAVTESQQRTPNSAPGGVVDSQNSKPDVSTTSNSTGTKKGEQPGDIPTPEIVLNLNNSRQEAYTTEMEVQSTSSKIKTQIGVEVSNSPLQGFAPSTAGDALPSIPSISEGSSLQSPPQKPTAEAGEGSVSRNDSIQALTALSSTLAANRRKSKQQQGDVSSSSFIFKSPLSSEDTTETIKRRAEAAHQKTIEDAVSQKQQELDTQEESELERLRSVILSKQDRLQKLEQEAFFVGLKQPEVDEAVGRSPSRKPSTVPPDRSDKGTLPLEQSQQSLTTAVSNNNQDQQSRSRLPSMMSESDWEGASNLFPDDGGDSQFCEGDDHLDGVDELLEEEHGESPFENLESEERHSDENTSKTRKSLKNATNKLRMFRRPNPGELKPVKLLDPSVTINESNKNEYFDSASRKATLSGLEELIQKAEEFIKNAYDGAVPEDILPKVDGVRGALIPVRQLLKDAKEEEKVFSETQKYFAEIAQTDEVAFSKLLRNFEEQVEAERQELRGALKQYLMNILRHSYTEAKAAAELAQMNAAVPPGEKGVQCNLEIDDVRDAGAFLSRITQQEKAIGQIFESVELLLKNLEASGDRFENALCCPRCKQKCVGGNRFVSLWPCGHVVCEECLHDLELELGEYLCEVCGGVCTDVLNDNLNAMVARTDFKRSGFTSFSSALEILKDELVEIDAKFIEATLSQYTASTVPSEEDYQSTRVVGLTSELTQDQLSSFDIPSVAEDDATVLSTMNETPGKEILLSSSKKIASAFLSGMKKSPPQ